MSALLIAATGCKSDEPSTSGIPDLLPISPSPCSVLGGSWDDSRCTGLDLYGPLAASDWSYVSGESFCSRFYRFSPTCPVESESGALVPPILESTTLEEWTQRLCADGADAWPSICDGQSAEAWEFLGESPVLPDEPPFVRDAVEALFDPDVWEDFRGRHAAWAASQPGRSPDFPGVRLRNALRALKALL